VRLHAPALLCLLLCGGCPEKKTSTPADSASSVDQQTTGPPLVVNAISFAGPAGHRADATFARGETVTCLFTVSRFIYQDHRADIVAEVKVRGPDDQLVLHQPDLVLLRGAAPTAKPGSIRSAATLALSPAATPGEQTVELIVRDRLGRRQGTGRGSFTLIGVPPIRARSLTLSALREAADVKLPAGSAIPLALELKGFGTAPGKGEDRRIQLDITASIEDQAGQRLSSRTELLLKTELPFTPLAYPLEYVTLLPTDLAPGPYRLALSIKDRVGHGTTQGLFRFQVVPRQFGIYNLHLHDAAGLSRRTFLLGEQLFVRLSVQGMQGSKEGEAKVEVDAAIAGPDGGVYLARKNAASIAGKASRPVAAASRFPAELPLVLPALCPVGKYRLVIRARDGVAHRDVVRELPFQIQGDAPKPMASFKVDRLEVQDRPDLPPGKGDTFGAGRSYHLTLRVGGAKLKQTKKMRFSARVKADLQLKDMTGKIVYQKPGLLHFERTLTYRPLRIAMTAKWEVPPTLRSGLYDLALIALDELDDRVSQLVRRVEIVGLP